MNKIKLTIDNHPVISDNTKTILNAAESVGIYIPSLCNHPNLTPNINKKPSTKIYQNSKEIKTVKKDLSTGCGLCTIEIVNKNKTKQACSTYVEEGMIILTKSPVLKKIRQDLLKRILINHPHTCLTCAQSEGCSRTQCSSNVQIEERCCPKLGNCELQKLIKYIGFPEHTPRWIPKKEKKHEEHPLFSRNYDLCIGCTRCVRACKELAEIEALGWIWNDKNNIQIGNINTNLTKSGCQSCTLCVEVCPTGAILDKKIKNNILSLTPCRDSCPANIDIPNYVQLISEGKISEALLLIYQNVPLPGILGRVCDHPCEKNCRRKELDESINICQLKRYTADYDNNLNQNFFLKKQKKIKYKIAIVGSGPTGLSAGFFLAQKGYQVTIFEAKEKPGGMLFYGIPAYRLPRKIIETEVTNIKKTGLKIITNKKIKNLDSLKKEYNAILLSLGKQLSVPLYLKGSDKIDSIGGIEFLKNINNKKNLKIKSKIIIIGGGNVAIDVALTSLREGAKEVNIVCLEKKEKMPAHPSEIINAQKEGIKIFNQWGPNEIIDNKNIKFLRCIKMFNEKGLFEPLFDKKETLILQADQIIYAIGTRPDLSIIKNTKINKNNNSLSVNPKTLETDEPGIFAGGDVISSEPGTVINAIASGRNAAISIDKYLGGNGNIDLNFVNKNLNKIKLIKTNNFSQLPRITPSILEINKRKSNYKEISLGYNDEEAQQEALRCLRCHLRLSLKKPQKPPKKIFTINIENLSMIPNEEGVLILFDKHENIIDIKGTTNLYNEMESRIEKKTLASYFKFEKDPFYSKKESQIIQKYLQEHGSMPPGDSTNEEDNLDDLF